MVNLYPRGIMKGNGRWSSQDWGRSFSGHLWFQPQVVEKQTHWSRLEELTNWWWWQILNDCESNHSLSCNHKNHRSDLKWMVASLPWCVALSSKPTYNHPGRIAWVTQDQKCDAPDLEWLNTSCNALLDSGLMMKRVHSTVTNSP